MQTSPYADKSFATKVIVCAFMAACILSMPQTLRADNDSNTQTARTLTTYNVTTNIPTLALSQAESGQSLTPYLEFMVDENGMATLQELFSPSYEDAFRPLDQGIPLTATGSTWLRLSITPDRDTSHGIALGSELATDVVLYVPDFSQYAENIADSLTDDDTNNDVLPTDTDTAKARAATPWQEFVIPHGEAITLPAITDIELLQQIKGLTIPVYIQMTGTPEPWFAPQLRSITDIAHDNSRLIHIGITMMLMAVLALCLLRAITEKGQWRLWTTLFTLTLLIQSVVGIPTTPHGSIGLAGLPNVLAPALALMLLPHIARHMLRRTEFSTEHIPANGSQLDADLDQQYRLLSIPCILLAIVPLLPNMGWLGKLLPLWPLVIFLFLPTTAIAVFRKISGAKLFLFGCLASIVAALCALIGMLVGMSATVINAIPLSGTALCALLIAGANVTQATKPLESQKNKNKEQTSSISLGEDYEDPLMGEGLRLLSADEDPATGIVLDGKVVESQKTSDSTSADNAKHESALTSSTIGIVRAVQTVSTSKDAEQLNTVKASEKLLADNDEAAHTGIAGSIDAAERANNTDEHTDIIHDSIETENSFSQAFAIPTSHVASTSTKEAIADSPSQSLTASVRTMEQEDVHTLVRAEEAMRYPLENLRKSMDALQKCTLTPDAKKLCQEAANASKQLDLVGEEFRSAAYRLPTESASIIFDLQRCLREAHDNVCAQSDAKNVALSWFMAPHLVQTYQGDADRLRTTLRVLMESAVDATDKGSVYLSARRVPDSTNPGHLLFTITDTGAGGPPERRKPFAIMQAWELATSTGGSLSIDSGKHGTTVSFSTRFLAIHNDNASAPHFTPRSNTLDPLRSLDGSNYATSGKHARIIIGAPAASNRQLLAFYLEDTAYYADEASSSFDITEKYITNGAELIILDGDITTSEMAKVITEIRQYENENDLSPVPFLALVRDEAQADAFLHIGCTQTLLKPVTRSGLCAQAALLAPVVIIPTNIENIENNKEYEGSESIHMPSLSPELINSTLTEAMELLTAPAQQDIAEIPSEKTDTLDVHTSSITAPESSTADVQGFVTTNPEPTMPNLTSSELAVPELENPNLAHTEVLQTTEQASYTTNNTEEVQKIALQDIPPTHEHVTETETAPNTDANTAHVNVPTSEAEDITLRLYDEYLQGEKSSLSPSMQALDPILFTNLQLHPSPKRAPKEKNILGSMNPKRDNSSLSQLSLVDEDSNDYNTSNEYVSAPRAVSTQKPTVAPAVAPTVAPTVEPPLTADSSVVTSVAKTLTSHDNSEPAPHTMTPTPESTPSAAANQTFVYSDAESEVSAPRPVSTQEQKPTVEPAIEPTLTADSSVDTSVAKTLTSNDNSEPTPYTITQTPEPTPSAAANQTFVYNDAESEVSAPRPVKTAAQQESTTQSSHQAQTLTSATIQGPTERANEVYVEEITVGNEVLRLYKVPTKPLDPDAEYDAMLKREASLDKPTSTQEQDILFQPWTNVADILPETLATEEPNLTAEPDVNVSSCEPSFTPKTIDDVAVHESATRIEESQISAVIEPEATPVIEPEATPVINIEDGIYELDADHSVSPASISDQEPVAQQEPDTQWEIEAEDDVADVTLLENKEPSAVQRATAALRAMCTSLREPAPLRIKEKTLPSLRTIRKAFELASTTNTSQPSENTSDSNDPKTEVQETRFVSIAQSVNELAVNMKPAPSILRHSGQKDFVPLLIAELQNTMNDATTAYEQNDITMLHASAARVADTAEALGLRTLERHTRCVERAAQAGDLSAARELYPDMENVVQQTISALRSNGLNGAHRM